jgi:hypothetical protein
MTTVPRIHAEFIKAWADGYDIEAYNPERDAWIICPEPGWFPDIEYRVRPGVIEKPKSKYDEYVVRVDQDPFDDDNLDITQECADYEHYNLKLLFKNGKLVQADIMDEETPW